MNYDDLVKGVNEFEESFWLGECIYFRALEELEEVRRNLSGLTEEYAKQIIGVFLSYWGGLGMM